MPDFKFNLLFVSRLTADNNCVFKFLDNSCVIQNFSTETILGIDNQINGMYCFAMRKATHFVGASVSTANDMWHKRLRHPFDVVLQVLNNELKFSGCKAIDVCDICHKAKQTRELFPLSYHKSADCFDLIHCNVWGSYRVASYFGFRYFFILVDDKSRVVWVYLMELKSEVGTLIKEFYNLIKT